MRAIVVQRRVPVRRIACVRRRPLRIGRIVRSRNDGRMLEQTGWITVIRCEHGARRQRNGECEKQALHGLLTDGVASRGQQQEGARYWGALHLRGGGLAPSRQRGPRRWLRSVWIFLARGRFAAKTPAHEGWISLDFLGFSRPNRDLSMGYAESTAEIFSSRFFPRVGRRRSGRSHSWHAEAHDDL